MAALSLKHLIPAVQIYTGPRDSLIEVCPSPYLVSSSQGQSGLGFFDVSMTKCNAVRTSTRTLPLRVLVKLSASPLDCSKRV